MGLVVIGLRLVKSGAASNAQAGDPLAWTLLPLAMVATLGPPEWSAAACWLPAAAPGLYWIGAGII